MSANTTIDYEALILETLHRDEIIYHDTILDILDSLRTQRRDSGLENPSVSEMVRSFMNAIDSLAEAGKIRALNYTTPSSPGRVKVVVFSRGYTVVLNQDPKK